MSARDKSPGRVSSENVKSATANFDGIRKISHILTLLLQSLLLHGDKFSSVFAL